ncbi:MAG: hypothetical protein V7676_15380 [Parasphingorhabdus sp.]|uniref:hypothetical protein n=1 Tax=Parasphingorhabdus sp. TaxID=2709688 RepID=UPI003003667E|tara:strand:- start:2926 stop:3264 length:339 start_codon:yes stop_codon:yes gene_type:complete
MEKDAAIDWSAIFLNAQSGIEPHDYIHFSPEKVAIVILKDREEQLRRACDKKLRSHSQMARQVRPTYFRTRPDGFPDIDMGKALLTSLSIIVKGFWRWLGQTHSKISMVRFK